MIRHAKNPVKQNTDVTDENLRNTEKAGSSDTSVQATELHTMQPDETAQESAAESDLVAPDIVPPARPVFRETQQEKGLQLKNRLISARMVIIFCAIVLILAILFLVLPRSEEASADQGRQAKWPELTFDDYFSGNYAGKIMNYYNHTASGHSILKTANTGLRSLFGPGSPDLTEEAAKASAGTGTSSSQTSDVNDEDAYYDIVQSRNYHTDNPDVKEEGGYLIVRQDGHWKALSLYSEGDMTLYSGTINYIRQMLNESVNIYCMPVPVSTQFYLPSNYEDRSADMKDSYRRLSIQLISGIDLIDIIDVLNNHNAEKIYLRTDNHWAPLAAYYAAREFAREADVPFSSLDTYISRTSTGYLGSIYELTGSTELLNDPEDFEYYIPVNRYRAYYYDIDYHYKFSGGLFFETTATDAYYICLKQDDQIVKIVTDTKNGRKLMMVKDSYGNAMIPFLTESFEEIYVVDQKYFNFNLINFANFTGVTDLLFLHDYNSLFDTQAELLEYITYSNLDAEIKDSSPVVRLPEEGNPDINGEEEETAAQIPAEPVTKPDEEKTGEETAEPEEAVPEEEPVWEDEPAWEDDGYVTDENDWYEESVDNWEDEGYYEDSDDNWEDDDPYIDSEYDWEDDGYYDDSDYDWEADDYYDDSEYDWEEDWE